MTVRDTVLASIRSVAEQQEVALPPLEDGLPLLDSGLDSLCIAIMVAQLEDRLEVDPFDTEEEFDFPVTVGDLIGLYERSVSGPHG